MTTRSDGLHPDIAAVVAASETPGHGPSAVTVHAANSAVDVIVMTDEVWALDEYTIL